MDTSEIKMHVREHMQYPATKQQIIQQCNMMQHVEDSDRAWFQDNLPEGTYNSAEEVIEKSGL